MGSGGGPPPTAPRVARLGSGRRHTRPVGAPTGAGTAAQPWRTPTGAATYSASERCSGGGRCGAGGGINHQSRPGPCGRGPRPSGPSLADADAEGAAGRGRHRALGRGEESGFMIRHNVLSHAPPITAPPRKKFPSNMMTPDEPHSPSPNLHLAGCLLPPQLEVQKEKGARGCRSRCGFLSRRRRPWEACRDPPGGGGSAFPSGRSPSPSAATTRRGLLALSPAAG